MGIIVQKYGGSSVATPELIRKVAQRVVATRQAGNPVVAVVSAMGGTTDKLLDLARSVSPTPARRELDMLVTTGERISIALLTMAITDLGYPAVSFTGSQSGIITTDNHTNARIIRVTPIRIQQALDAGRIVIVAGFQGVSERLEITSLGRGGTDTTAVALAAALDAEYAEICSDVDGVYSADPRKVAGAQRIDVLDYGETQALADAGAKVLNAEAVEWARRNGVTIVCAKTHDPDRAPGTRIRKASGLEQPRVAAIAAHPGIFYLEPAAPGAPPPEDLSTTLAAHGAPDAWIVHLPSGWGAVVPRQNIHSEDAFRAGLSASGTVFVRGDLQMVSVIGRALGSPPGVLGPARAALAAAGVPVRGLLMDASRASFLIDAGHGDAATQALHQQLIEATP